MSTRRTYLTVWVTTISPFLLLSVGCYQQTPAFISAEHKFDLCKQVKTKPYMALFEGLQPYSGERAQFLGQRLSIALGVVACATSGNQSEHMAMINEAYRHHQPIYIIGYSLGEMHAIGLAEECEREKIPVEKIFLVDGPMKMKIPSNVKVAVDIVGTVPYPFRRKERYFEFDLKSKNTLLTYHEVHCGHLSIAGQSDFIFLSEIPLAK